MLHSIRAPIFIFRCPIALLLNGWFASPVNKPSVKFQNGTIWKPIPWPRVFLRSRYYFLFRILKYGPGNNYLFVVVNFDALAQASDIQIERRHVVFLCCMQDLNPESQTPNRQQTECPLTKRLSYRRSSLKTWTRQPVRIVLVGVRHCQILCLTIRCRTVFKLRYSYLDARSHCYWMGDSPVLLRSRLSNFRTARFENQSHGPGSSWDLFIISSFVYWNTDLVITIWRFGWYFR